MNKLNTVCAAILSLGKNNQAIMPMFRFRQERRALSLYVLKYRNSELVKEYTALMACRVKLWKSCVVEVTKSSKFNFMRAGLVSAPSQYLRNNRYFEFLEPINIGNVDLSTKSRSVQVDELAEWLHVGENLWQRRCK